MILNQNYLTVNHSIWEKSLITTAFLRAAAYALPYTLLSVKLEIFKEHDSIARHLYVPYLTLYRTWIGLSTELTNII